MDYAVAVGPLEADLSERHAPGSEDYPVSQDMASILEVAGVFGAVRSVPLMENGEPAVPSDADFLLRLRAHRLEVKYEGRNRYFIPNLLLWATFIFPAWWVPDETFSGKVDLEAVLVSTRSGNRLGSHTASVSFERELDDFERGWFPLGIFLAPHVFSRGNWRRAGREVLLPAIRTAQIDLARWMNDSFRERAEAGDIDALSATCFALCVGVSKYESARIPVLDPPRREAKLLADFLSDPQLGGVRPSRVACLLDDAATGAALRRMLETILVEKPRAPDTVLLYFSGTGTVSRTAKGVSHVLLPYDADPDDTGGSGLSLKALGSLVSRSRAGRVVVVIDAGFAGGPKARGFGPPPVEEKALHRALTEMTVRGRGLVLLVERTAVSEGPGFLADFTSALAGKGDLDVDGRVTGAELAELFTKTAPPAGCTVRVFGENLESVTIPFARGRSK
jgi:hypothetical protein